MIYDTFLRMTIVQALEAQSYIDFFECLVPLLSSQIRVYFVRQHPGAYLCFNLLNASNDLT